MALDPECVPGKPVGTTAAVIVLSDRMRVIGLGKNIDVSGITDGWVQVGDTLISPYGVVIMIGPDTEETHASLREMAR